MTAAALKGAIFAANVYERLGFKVVPNVAAESRHDIIQAVEFGFPEGLTSFCEGIQAAAPVDSYVTPEPWAMPGYDSDVIMAAGAFIQGSSIELSADGPPEAAICGIFSGRTDLATRQSSGFLCHFRSCMRKGMLRFP